MYIFFLIQVIKTGGWGTTSAPMIWASNCPCLKLYFCKQKTTRIANIILKENDILHLLTKKYRVIIEEHNKGLFITIHIEEEFVITGDHENGKWLSYRTLKTRKEGFAHNQTWTAPLHIHPQNLGWWIKFFFSILLFVFL